MNYARYWWIGLSFTISGMGCLEQPTGGVSQEEYDELIDRVEALEEIARYVTIVDGNVVIEGTNLIVRNGSGATDTDNPSAPGTGNLIIGYNEAAGDETRSGWHNLIIGRYNDWQSYGGMLGGEYNTLAAPASTVSGGRNNVTSNSHSAILGGEGAHAEAECSAVVGGYRNAADGSHAVVVGGRDNRATGTQSVVTGGIVCNTSAEGEVAP